jgi:CHASE2 domain-containing sensor protein
MRSGGAVVKECPRCGVVAGDAEVACAVDGERLESGLPGDTVLDGRYRLERRLGAGGMGIVYAAVHVALGRRFAVKVLGPSDRVREDGFDAFRLEARALGALAHPGIVAVTDFGVDPRSGGLPFLVMELLEGEPLSERLVRSGPPERSEAIAWIERIAEALDHAHGRGVVHRDLKPGNVFLVPEKDGSERPRLLDFGIARLFDAADSTSAPRPVVAPAAIVGTIGYLAPELLEGKAPTPSADVYAFALVAFEILTGSKRFAPSARGVQLPQELEAAVAAALAEEPTRRPRSAGLVAGALRTAFAAARRREFERRERPRRLVLAAVLGVGAAALVPTISRTPVVERAVLASFDRQVRALPARAPDAAFVALLVDESTLAATARPWSAEGDAFGRRIRELFAAGASGVAIDLLLPRAWSDSRPFAEALLAHGERLTLGAFSTRDGRVLGPEALSPLVAGGLGEGAERLFGFLNLEDDLDGVVRRGRALFVDRDGEQRLSFAAAAVARAGLGSSTAAFAARFWLDRSIALERLPRYRWQDVPTLAASGAFRDRLVFVGGDFADGGEDAHAIFAGGDRIPGLLVHVLAAATIRGGAPLREGEPWPRLAVTAVAVTVACGLALLGRSPRGALLAALGGVAAFAIASELLLRGAGRVEDAVAPAVALGIATLLALAIRAQLSPVPRGAAASSVRGGEAPEAIG